jgi:hypothetical protein
MHILVAGWFSFEQMGNTAGDMIACDAVCSWLKEAGISYDVAVATPFSYKNKVHIDEVDPALFTDIVFVCGPFGNGWPVTDMLSRFSHCRLSGVNLSLMEPLEKWDPFTFLYERESSRASNPDITFSGPAPSVPVAGIILAHKQKEYGNRALHEQANAAIEALIGDREVSVVRIDTALENNQGGLRTPGEVESLIAKMDLVITTRLHGTVLSLKNGVPVIPVDPIAGGAKISSQVATFNWPLLFSAGKLDHEALLKAFDYCLTAEARAKALECARQGREAVAGIKEKFIRDFSALAKSTVSYV